MTGFASWIWQGYLVSMRRYRAFSGRSRREEVWSFGLAAVALGLLSAGFDRLVGLNGPGAFGLFRIVQIVHVVPFLALGARRFHDLDRTGWWVFVPPAWTWALRLRGVPQANRFGMPAAMETGPAPIATSERSEAAITAITGAFGLLDAASWFVPMWVGLVFCLAGALFIVASVATAPKGPWWIVLILGLALLALGATLLRVGQRRFRRRGDRHAPGPAQKRPL